MLHVLLIKKCIVNKKIYVLYEKMRVKFPTTAAVIASAEAIIVGVVPTDLDEQNLVSKKCSPFSASAAQVTCYVKPIQSVSGEQYVRDQI